MTMEKKIKIGLIVLSAGIVLISGLVLFLSNEKPSLEPSLNEMKKCYSDDDLVQCVKVKADCCGCNAGGTAIAINKRYKSYWENRLAEKCKEIECPAVMSNDPSCFQKVGCINDECQLYD